MLVLPTLSILESILSSSYNLLLYKTLLDQKTYLQQIIKYATKQKQLENGKQVEEVNNI